LENDPDDFPVEEDAFRTLINQQGIVAINDTIFVFRNEGDYAIFRTSQKNNLLNNLNEFLTAANNNQLGSFLVQNDFAFAAPNTEAADCRGNQSRKKLFEYVSGRRIKCKVFARARFFRRAWGSKTVHFTKNSRGKWKRSRASVIYAGFAGDHYQDACNFLQTVNGSKEERNRVKARACDGTTIGFFPHLKVKKNSFGSAHSVTNEGIQYDEFISITW
jgi:hypothetical protein